MSLTLQNYRESIEQSMEDKDKSTRILAKYLNCALNAAEGKPRKKVKSSIKKHVSSYATLGEYNPLQIDALEEKTDKLIAAEGTKAKLNYLSDSRSIQKVFKEAKEMSKEKGAKGFAVGAVVLAAGMTAAELWAVHAVVSLANEKAANVVVGYMLGKMAAKSAVAVATRAKTPAEKERFDNYADLKHAQLAIKLLKKELGLPSKKDKEKQENRQMARELLASGLGNPGGMITPLDFKTKQGR